MPRRKTPDGSAMNTNEAARFLGLSTSTLEKQRVYGGGPQHLKYSKAVRYLKEDLVAWRERGRSGSPDDTDI